MRCTGIPGSDLFKMHKMHMLNMLKYTESTKGMTEPVDKLRSSKPENKRTGVGDY